MENKIICFCKGVSYQQIVDAVNNKGAKVQEDIERITGASSGCGRCKRKVISILEELNQGKN